MKLRLKIITFLLCLVASLSHAQVEKFNYKRSIDGVSDQWHKITLPVDIYGRVSSRLNDLRIYGITNENDTVEAPYLLKKLNGKHTTKEISFELMNVSQNAKGHYFTFKVASAETVDQISLDFNQENFDWKVQLEGSQDQQEWFTLVDDYRILSIKNPQTDYHFTKVSFPNATYSYYRLLIKTPDKPALKSAKVLKNDILKPVYNDYKIVKKAVSEDQKGHKTILDIDLEISVPVNYLQVEINEDFDFYRPVRIQYLSDSVKTEMGWHYNYKTIGTGILNSIENNAFSLDGNTLKKLRLIIENRDNEPLSIGKITAKGYQHELLARFTKTADYFLVYGGNVRMPSYDINHHTANIPANLAVLQLGKEEEIDHPEELKASPLFENKAWLWGIMILLIGMLGWFSFRMMGKE
ncbi:DUF3999 family protein [Flexithrix dorotheae]|uniref:DUF3999 family protein n=1 Tax=Flexithrix dorotheae TaxID=70993 RepID=UPI00036FB990|nr:DUF3999 family protein [Flexithrix dorotheae]